MARSFSIDPELVELALSVSGERTKEAAVTLALKEFIARREQKNFVDLIAKFAWDDDCNYKAERSGS